MKFIKSFIDWLRPSIEDHTGAASYRRLTALVFVILDLYIVATEKIKTQLMLNVHYSILVFVLVLIGIVTVQNVLTFLNKDKVENQ